MLGSLILSAINVIISCLLCWMVHGRYPIPKFIKNYVFRYLGKMSLPINKSNENKLIDEELEQVQQHFLNKISKIPREQANREWCDEFLELGNVDSQEAEGRNQNENMCQINEASSDSVLNNQQGDKSEKVWVDRFKEMQKSINMLRRENYYFVLLKLKENFDPHGMAQEELKKLAVILNRVSGLVLIIINFLLLFYTGLVMLTDYDGIDWNF